MKHIYLWLTISILFEVIGATFMKVTGGFNHVGASLIVVVSYAIALTIYIFITRDHEIGWINALWSGGGTFLVAILGIVIFNESTTFLKLFGISLIIIGMIGLNLNNKGNQHEKGMGS